MARKVSDEFVVPLCASHHDALHWAGDEKKWWRDSKIDPLSVASCLWDESRSGQADRARKNAGPDETA